MRWIGPMSAPSTLELIRSSSEHTTLHRRLKSGKSIRIGRGCYVDTASFLAATSVARYDVLLEAVESRTVAPLCCESALWANGISTFGVPSRITTIAAGGRHGRQPRLVQAAAGIDLRWIPLHFRHRHVGEVVTAANGMRIQAPWEAAASVLCHAPLENALTVADALSHAPADTRDRVRAAIAKLPYPRWRARAERRLDFGRTGAATSLESGSRAVILRAGLPEPALQQEFDDDGGLIGFVDMWWEQAGLIGEADGRGKYVEARFAHQRTPMQVFEAEKDRQDRLLALGHEMRRWQWEHVLRKEALLARLRSTRLEPGKPLLE